MSSDGRARCGCGAAGLFAGSLRQALFLLALAGLCSALWARARPMPPRGEHAGSVPAAEAIGWGDAALWVDARTEAEFAAGHWPGAVLLNEDAWNELVEGFLERWEPGKKVAVYCSDSGCRRSEEVARRLRQEVGLEEVWSIRGGWEAMGRSRQ